MGITVSEIDELVARYGNKRIEEQANMAAPFLKMIDEVKIGGATDIINIKGGETDGVQFIADQGTLPTGGSKQPVQAVSLPKYLLGRLAIPRGAATLANGKADGVNIVFEQLDTLGAQLSRMLCRGLIKKALVTLSAAQATELDAIALGASGTFTVVDVFGMRVGTILERYTGSTYKEQLRVTKIVMDVANNSHTVTVTRNVDLDGSGESNDDATAGDVLYLRGAYSNGMVTLDECADESTDVYGHDADTNDWIGNLKSSVGTLSSGDMRDLWSQASIRGGAQPDFVLGNSRTRQLYSDELTPQRRFHSGRMDVSGGVDVEFEGKPFKVDENCPFDSIYFVKKSDFKLACWKSFMDDGDGGLKSPSAGGHALVSQSNFEYDHQRWGAYNAHCIKRANLGALTGITG